MELGEEQRRIVENSMKTADQLHRQSIQEKDKSYRRRCRIKGLCPNR